MWHDDLLIQFIAHRQFKRHNLNPAAERSPYSPHIKIQILSLWRTEVMNDVRKVDECVFVCRTSLVHSRLCKMISDEPRRKFSCRVEFHLHARAGLCKPGSMKSHTFLKWV